MKFCSHCSAPVSQCVPDGDLRPRDVCDGCGTIFYENPKLVVGTVLEWQHRILLCRRAIEPRSGLWTLPAGFMENGETMAEGALRETVEEAGAHGVIDALFSIVDIAAINQVHLFFRGRLASGKLDPGPETLEAGFFEEQEIPWKEIAFSSVRMTLERYFEDRKLGQFSGQNAAHARTHTLVLDLDVLPQSFKR